MKILAVGGGSGGHVTPVVAVLRELKHRDHDVEIRFWCDRKFAPQAKSIMHHFDEHIPVQPILSGKLRRYHALPLWRQLLRPVSIVLPNLRDAFLAFCGFLQSFFKLLVWRPDVVFTKGGYVCLPVGFAAKLLGIPLVIHDSDAHPGLTNRVLSRWATAIATGAPLEYYPYPKNISRYVGIPISDQFVPMNEALRKRIKKELGFDERRPLIVITGGGLGAKRLNNVVAQALPELLRMSSIMLISGTGQYDELRATTPQDDERYQLHDFISEGMASILGAADIVVTRAGATIILELAALAKPTILVPNAYLTAGHQLKNAAVYAEKDAVTVLDEKQLEAAPDILVSSLAELLISPAKKQKMAKQLHAFAKPDAARDMADMIMDATKRT
jgi:UDP-N-acetylglucosamine--N-acetylmuramyl-(pentapeptide) pyrophosphoryl-undecaprenol N-acetylglucosamine transferase